MRRNKIEVYLHLIWTTWDRLPLIEPEWERRLYRNMAGEAHSLGVEILALNGVADHVHLVVSLPTTVTIAHLVKQLKGVSSHFVNETIQPEALFKWQGNYAAFSISRRELDTVVGYVKRQKDHHAQDDLIAEWEESHQTVHSPGAIEL